MAKDLFWLACYVMFSRAKTLEGLLCLRLPTTEELNTGPPEHILVEIDRLLALERSSEKRLHLELRNRSQDLPGIVRDLFANPRPEQDVIQRKRLKIK